MMKCWHESLLLEPNAHIPWSLQGQRVQEYMNRLSKQWSSDMEPCSGYLHMHGAIAANLGLRRQSQSPRFDDNSA